MQVIKVKFIFLKSTINFRELWAEPQIEQTYELSGIYIHIPFCKQACHYCDFHFSTNLKLKSEMIAAIKKEIYERKSYLTSPIQSIYFGGGTPSILDVSEIETLLEELKNHFSWEQEVEITLEANPDDINEADLEQWKAAGINRLSIGIQSFDEGQLRFMNRAHSATESAQCLELAKKAGFDNFNVDLIYGIPYGHKQLWKESLEKILSYSPNHISAYSLTIEQGTVFGNWQKKGRMEPLEEELTIAEYHYLVERLAKAGFEHYEVSNFALPGKYSKHNTAYWQGKKYLGIGPGAHSYDGRERSYNVAHNKKYIDGVINGTSIQTIEMIHEEEAWTEYLMISLRTKWGIQLDEINRRKPEQLEILFEILANWEKKNLGSWNQEKNSFRLSEAGFLLVDSLVEELLI